ncbi:MAG: PaaI family thioesterase [Actinobacteria bacterium]|nr:PaaI family thioesterase [Actinomycetota bacterium]
MTTTEERRTSVEDLAGAIRVLADAAAETAVDPAIVRDVAATVRDLTARLAAATNDDPYSDLRTDPIDDKVPSKFMPINPIIGDCNAGRPDVQVHYEEGEVRGRANLSKRFTGPPGFAHGGITAMLADQIVALTPGAAGLLRGGITKSLTLRYRKPVPIGEEIALWGVCVPDGDDLAASFTISTDAGTAVEGNAVIVSAQRLYKGDPPTAR